jgi:uncharacterized protein with von Willebrand factor type A (vWA) domain
MNADWGGLRERRPAVPGRDITALLVGFARTLRHAGVEATPDRVPALLAAADALGAGTVQGVYWAGRLTLCGSRDDLAVYDAAFAGYFGGATPGRLPGIAPQLTLPRPSAPFAGPDASEQADAPDAVLAMDASPAEVLRQRDLAALTAAERDEVRRLVALLAPATAPRPSRRYRPGRRGDVDPPRSVRLLLRHGGEPTRLAYRRRRVRPRRLVLLLDVSGSMSPYADALLRFGHAAVRRHPTRTEVFTLGTRLTRISRALQYRDPDVALRAAGSAIADWHGGTRLAESLKAFLDRYGQRGMARGAVVVLCSDGWERGDPAQLAGQLARLSLLAYRLVWVNPHRGKPGFAPLAGGMAAALPYLDDFVAGHSLAALEELVQVIAHA